MASRQEKMERAEAEAKQASFDIADANRLREYEERPKTTTLQEQTVTQEEDRPGVFGSVFRKVADTVGHAKDAVVGKSYQAAEKTKEGTYTATEKAAETAEGAADAVKGKAGEYTDYTADKANQARDKAGEHNDYTAEKSKETKDSAARNANEAKDYTAEKANEAKDKAIGAKDYTAYKAKQTKDYAATKANEMKDKAVEYKDYTAEKAKEAKDSAIQKAGETKDYTAEKAKEAKDYSGEKAVEGKDAAAGKLGGLAESAKGAARKAMGLFSGKKQDTAAHVTNENLGEAEARAAHEQGGAGRKRDEDIVFVVKETKQPAASIAVADALKTSDQMSGQTFNDVGRFDDEDRR